MRKWPHRDRWAKWELALAHHYEKCYNSRVCDNIRQKKENAGGGNRTHKSVAHTILSRARLPVPPLRHGYRVSSIDYMRAYVKLPKPCVS